MKSFIRKNKFDLIYLCVLLTLPLGVITSAQVIQIQNANGGGSGAGYTNLVQVDANTLAERNATNSQEFRLNETYTSDATQNYLSTYFSAAAPQGGATNSWIIKPKVFSAGVEGIPRPIYLWGSAIYFRANGNGATWSVGSNGEWFNNGGGSVFQNTIDTAYRTTYDIGIHGIFCWSGNATAASSRTFCFSQGAPGVMTLFSSSPQGTAYPQTTSGTWQAGDPGTRPTCDVNARGMYWHDFGGAGVKDDIAICAKDAADVYAWRVVY